MVMESRGGKFKMSQKRIAEILKLVEFLNWELHKGQKMAAAILYAPLPEKVVKMVEKTIKTIK